MLPQQNGADPLRAIELGTAKKHRSTWKITVAVAGVVIVLVAVALIIVFVVLGRGGQPPKNVYFRGNFRISNANYTALYENPNSSEFRMLAAQIEAMLNTTYGNSDLKKEYVKSQVIKLSPGSVVPQFLVLFSSLSTGNDSALKGKVQSTLLQTLLANSTGTFAIDPNSLQIQEATTTEAANLLLNVPSRTTPRTTVQATTGSLPGCGRRMAESSARITGGTNAKIGEWPWMASLLFKGYHRCGATLLSNSWLVTAAHCFDWQKDFSEWTVRLGTIDLIAGDGLKLKDVLLYPGYTSETHDNDIALLQLDKPINFTRNILPVCLPEASRIFPADSLCYIVGWGALREGGDYSPTLHQGQIRIIDTEECMQSVEYIQRVTSSMLCAGYMNGTVDTCQMVPWILTKPTSR
ncbi:transmembrane protease serine 11D-like isoform X2 [Ambystoma mexicanum]|uniref:transmembrane protease serine 11D-like isoform X2 n=1 Tax=Ambystoma mexicanum TaxID=8296 RepID=UPI0037E74B91